MPRMDIIEAWRDGYAHGVKDTVDACQRKLMKVNEPHQCCVAQCQCQIVDIGEYRSRKRTFAET